MRILLIEDDRKAARLLARGLEEEGFVVDAVHSAEEGDERAFVQAYDLLVLDWMLPGGDGLSLCRERPLVPGTQRHLASERAVSS